LYNYRNIFPKAAFFPEIIEKIFICLLSISFLSPLKRRKKGERNGKDMKNIKVGNEMYNVQQEMSDVVRCFASEMVRFKIQSFNQLINQSLHHSNYRLWTYLIVSLFYDLIVFEDCPLRHCVYYFCHLIKLQSTVGDE
jgi:hypothetical protein